MCRNTETCFAGGSAMLPGLQSYAGVVMMTKNGGRAWKAVLEVPTAEAEGMLCPSADTCYATFYIYDRASKMRFAFILRTTNDGRTWHKLRIGTVAKSQGLVLGGMVCSAANDCLITAHRYADVHQVVILSAAILRTHDGWRTWQSTPVKQGNSFIICESTTRCLLVDSSRHMLQESADAGRTWRRLPSTSEAYLYWVDHALCSGPKNCYRMTMKFGKHECPCTGTIDVTTDGGHIWRTRYNINAFRPQGTFDGWGASDCTQFRMCYAFPVWTIQNHNASTLLRLKGTKWVPVHFFPNIVPDYLLTCPSGSRCYLLGNRNEGGGASGTPVILRTDDGGRTWKTLG